MLALTSLGGAALLSLALVAPARAEPLVQRGLLVCPDTRTCEEDAEWLRSIADGGPGGFDVLDFEDSFAPGSNPDGLAEGEAWRDALAQVRDAALAEKWGPARESADRAVEALAAWKGPASTQELFDLWYLRGAAALETGRDEAWAYSFRQAAAIANGQPLALSAPEITAKAKRAWKDEQRKLFVGGKGTLVLSGGPAGTRWTVDGRPADEGEVYLLPGNHRVSAIAPGQVRSWTAEVPVLAGRSSAVSPDFALTDDAAWLYWSLDDAITSLEAPDPVLDLLVAWAEEHEVDELRLMRVEEVDETPDLPKVELSDPPADRPAAAAGERFDAGDGVPTTYEDEVVHRYLAPAEEHVVRVKRVRMAWFDPKTRRLSTDPRAATPLAARPERLRLGLRTGAVGMMQRLHGSLDLQLAVPVGPVEVDARLGLVRADQAYNLYADWVDQQLYHLYLGARWAPDWWLAPYAAVGAEVYAPAALGGRAGGGLQARFDGGHWLFEVEGSAALLDEGLGWGAGLGLSRGF